MSQITSRTASVLLSLLLALTATLGIAPGAVAATSAQAACGDTSGFRKVALSSLPPQAADTTRLIRAGGPYPYPQDNQTFHNREGVLPSCSTGYYREYTVKTPGSATRGARRIVTGNGSPKLYFYTADHYATFVLVDIGR
ncbi:guanyl-specific ribonuclease Sa [Saccharothrix coeruleofusca]|uniref:ribonuclease domain-containing protein n=1 Tax=Saccharothrix coeruleofusca TaxID=33919 RepID=UPI001AEACF19|nr:ribonuclease domain-containing protein [Saccharothrix coeruleofusca]MBP2338575.1 guanyl-specific ribonuclease Sa [Saccharothrix coeruleofusca]